MRIALLTYSTKPRGGVVHTLALAEALAAQHQDVTVWTLGRGGDQAFFRPVDPRVTVRVVPFDPDPEESVGERILRSIQTLGEAFAATTAKEPYDLVHAQDCISANAVPRCVRTIHHLDTFTTPELAACHEKAITTPVARICVSAAVAAEVHHGWGLQPTVIPNGVDTDRFLAAAGDSPAARQDRQRWTDRYGRYVLAVGGIEPRKGSIDLLEAFALVRRARSDVRLVFAGGETLFDYRDYRARFEHRAQELDVDYEVLGTVPDELMPSLIAASSVFSFVSVKEGFGLAAMEALAAGVPVIARDLPVLREVLGNSATFAGDVPAIAEAILSALDGEHPDPDAGRNLARSYRWDEVAAQHLQLYRRVLESTPFKDLRQPRFVTATAGTP